MSLVEAFWQGERAPERFGGVRSAVMMTTMSYGFWCCMNCALWYCSQAWMGENARVVRTGVSINGTMDATAQLAGRRGKLRKLREYAFCQAFGVYVYDMPIFGNFSSMMSVTVWWTGMFFVRLVNLLFCAGYADRNDGGFLSSKLS